MSSQQEIRVYRDKRRFWRATLIRLVIVAGLAAVILLSGGTFGILVVVVLAIAQLAPLLLLRGDRHLALVATPEGIWNRFTGRLAWDDVAEIRIRGDKPGRRRLELRAVDRRRVIDCSPSRFYRVWMRYVARRKATPLLRMNEHMWRFDATKLLADLDALAGRSLAPTAMPGEGEAGGDPNALGR